jgi:hypothetical protein
MQYAYDGDLAAAIKSELRTFRGILEFDWDRDGEFQHPLSDMSGSFISAKGDGSIRGDVPDEVNALSGYSSREVSVVMGGNHEGGQSMHVLFSPWVTNSPLYGYEIIGTPVRYSRSVLTEEGTFVVRKFTGWVRELELSRTNDEVTLTLSDIADIQARLATLPLWACFDNEAASFTPPNPNRGWSRPISSTWVIEELLRQGGRPTGPVARPDAKWYCTNNGSFIPSIGTFNDGSAAGLFMHSISWQNNDPWIDGMYGLAPRIVETGVGTEISTWGNYSVSTVSDPMRIPFSGDSGRSWGVTNPDYTVGIAGWYYDCDGVGTTSAASFGQVYVGFQYGRGFPGETAASFNASDYLNIYKESEAFGTGPGYGLGLTINHLGDITFHTGYGAGTNNVWKWRNTTQRSQGWHYIDARMRFQENSVSLVEVRIDDAVVSMTNINTSTGGLKRSSENFERYVDNLKRNRVVMTANIPMQHFQVFGARTADIEPYSPAQKFPPLTADGLPKAIVHNSSLAELTHIPDVEARPVWDVLQEVTNGDFGTLSTDEFGVVHYMPHYTMRADWNSKLDTATEITDEHLLGFVVNPTFDGVRNSITIEQTTRKAIQDIVWQADDPELYQISGYKQWLGRPLEGDVIAVGSYRLPYITKPQDVVPPWSPYQNPMDSYKGTAGSGFGSYNEATSREASPADINPLTGGVLAVRQANYDQYFVTTRENRNHNEMFVDSRPAFYQRKFNLYADIYSGTPIRFAFRGGKEPALAVTGLKYGGSDRSIVTVKSTSSVNEIGLRELVLQSNEWRQTEATATAIATSVLNDTTVPVPAISGLEIPSDPRLQLLDVVRLSQDAGITGVIVGQIVGMAFDDSPASGYKDMLDIRILETVGEWVLGDPDRSQLDTTTILG